MGFFGFGNKNKVKKQTAEQGAEWQQLQNVQFAGAQPYERTDRMAYMAPEMRGGVAGGGEMAKNEAERKEELNNERRRRKLAAALLTGLKERGPDREERIGDVIEAHDAPIDADQYDMVLDLMAEGKLGWKEGQEVISRIQRPADTVGVQEVYQRLQTRSNSAGEEKSMKRILGNFSSTGFRDYDKTGPKDVREFLERFPDAMSFDIESEEFLESIHNRNNPPERIKTYYESMKKFKLLMYGNEQKYLDQFKVMQGEAMSRRRRKNR